MSARTPTAGFEREEVDEATTSRAPATEGKASPGRASSTHEDEPDEEIRNGWLRLDNAGMTRCPGCGHQTLDNGFCWWRDCDYKSEEFKAWAKAHP